MDTPQPRRLPIITPQHEISGRVPRQFERAVKSCTVGDARHSAALYASATLAARGIDQCLPPTSGAPYRQALELLRGWCDGKVPYRQIRDRRAQVFEQAPRTEQQVQRTMAAALAAQGSRQETALDLHAGEIVQRYLGLSLHHAVGAVLLVLDGTQDPALLLDVAGEVSGAVAYKQVALGAGRSAELRKAAISQATWESRRVIGSAGHSEAALSVQLFHEYLGVHWKNHVDAQRLCLEDFLTWAFQDLA